jgi:hypothetical protein
MTYTANPTTDEHRVKQQNQYREATSPSQQAATLQTPSSLRIGALPGDRRLSGRAGGSTRAAAFQAMQQTHGNRAVQRYIQRATPQQAIPVQRWGLDDIWDPIAEAGSAAWDAVQNEASPTPDQEPVGPVVGPDNLFWPVGPVVEGDNIAVPGYGPYV